MILYSNKRHIAEIPRMYTQDTCPTSSRHVCKRWRNEDGTVGVRGDKELKATQAYPKAFGAALAQLYRQHEAKIKIEAEAAIRGWWELFDITSRLTPRPRSHRPGVKTHHLTACKVVIKRIRSITILQACECGDWQQVGVNVGGGC